MADDKTKDVEVMLGNPKKALIAMSVPIVIAMIVQSMNNLIDTAWVSGLGTEALNAVGFSFPMFFIIMGIGNGIGIGASSAIARFIGKEDKENAEAAVGQAILMTLIISIVAGIVLLFAQRPIFELIAPSSIEGCIEYCTPMFICLPILLLNFVIAGLLRSEGASKKSMITQILTAVINMTLDPFFIYDYGLGLGLAGACWATMIAMMFTLALMLYWYFFTDSTYLKIRTKHMRSFNRPIDNAILRVGIPSSSEMIFISLIAVIVNIIVSLVDPASGVALYTSVWKLVDIAFIPMMGVGSAIVPICAAAYGARKPEKIATCYRYGTKTLLIVTVVICAFILIFAEGIVTIFTYAGDTVALRSDMTTSLRICCIFLLFVPPGFLSVGVFQSLGMGVKSLICTIIRTTLQIPFTYVVVLTGGTITDFWFGTVASEIVGSVIAGIWCVLVIRVVMKEMSVPQQQTTVQ